MRDNNKNQSINLCVYDNQEIFIGMLVSNISPTQISLHIVENVQDFVVVCRDSGHGAEGKKPALSKEETIRMGELGSERLTLQNCILSNS